MNKNPCHDLKRVNNMSCGRTRELLPSYRHGRPRVSSRLESLWEGSVACLDEIYFVCSNV